MRQLGDLWERLLAFATLKKYRYILEPTAKKELSKNEKILLDECKPIEKAIAVAKENNLMVMSYFTMSFTTPTLMNKVHKSKTKEWPGGLAWRLVEELKKEYAPTDMISNVEINNRLLSLSMKHNEDPKNWGRELWRSKTNSVEGLMIPQQWLQ